MRERFEDAASHLIEVDPYCCSTRQNQNQQRHAYVSAVPFAGYSTSGVDLRWHSYQEFCELTLPQKDELTSWQNSFDGKKEMRKQRNDAIKKQKHEDGNKSGNNGNTENNSWCKKFKKALKTLQGLSPIMSVLREEETNNSGLISALQPSLPPVPASTDIPAPPTAPSALVSVLVTQFPAMSTKVTLNSILKNSSQQQKK